MFPEAQPAFSDPNCLRMLAHFAPILDEIVSENCVPSFKSLDVSQLEDAMRNVLELKSGRNTDYSLPGTAAVYAS